MNKNYNQLKLKVVWLASEDINTQSSQLLMLRSFFLNQKLKNENPEYSLHFGNIKEISSLNTRCKETFYEIDCTLSGWNIIQKIEPDATYSKIYREWCSFKDNLFHWLKPICNEGFFQQKDQFHEDIQVNSIAFGTFINMTSFVQHYIMQESQHWNQNTGIIQLSSSFWHDQRNLQLFAYIRHHSKCFIQTPEFYKFIVNYTDIMRVLIDDPSGQPATSLFLLLQYPPRIFTAHNILDNKTEENEIKFKRLPIRVINVTNIKKMSGSVNTWERVTEIGCSCEKTYIKGKVIGKCPVLKITVADKVRARHIIGRLYQRCHSDNIYYSSIKLYTWYCTRIICPFISFKCKYAWKALMTRSFEVLDQIINELDNWEHLCKILSSFEKENSSALEKALFEFSSYLEKGIIISFSNAIKDLFEFHNKNMIINENIEGTCLIRRAFITPLRFILLPLQQHFDNRVLRNFNPEFALRVSIRDDNLGQLTYCLSKKNGNNFLEKTIGKYLREGIYIAPRHYKFLAASASQLRDHGIWMYAIDSESNTAESIREWLGDFTGIDNIAKVMSRMGQCFSTSEEAIQIEIGGNEVVYERDILGERSSDLPPYIFSDGIGMISSDLIDEIHKIIISIDSTINDQKNFYKSSAFQIRLAGCKGMLVENPKLEKRRIVIRDSMKKFECTTASHLEIIKRSAPRPLFLNRPLITILEQLGIPQNVFLNLQENMILEFTDALVNESKACKLLTKWIPLNLPFEKLLESGIAFTQEPFFNSLLINIYKTKMGFLKSKTKIAVPFNYGRNMFGVLDETRTLEYGQVFIQYSESIMLCESSLHILKGTVLVTKCPCMHPGDVRKFQAVDVEDLHHIKDCIVFPSKGPRPHPDEMAGSDLDGDEYVVIWMPELFFPGENIEPMDFPIKVKCFPRNSPITVDDMIGFLLDYIKNDNVGRLGNAHLAWADREKEGIFSEMCLNIARKYPFSVDFAKTGQTAFLTKSERPDKYPDFMGKKGLNNSYRSERILGHLYRYSRSLESAINQPVCQDSLITIDNLLEYPGWENYNESAEADRIEYEHKLMTMLQLYNIDNEGEILSGHIQRVSKYDEMKGDKRNVINLVHKSMQFLQEKFRIKFFEDLKETDESCENYKENLYQKASAWYMVTYTKPNTKFRSFPWSISSILAEIRLTRLTQIINPPMRCSLIERIDHVIINNCNIENISIDNDELYKGHKLAFNTLWNWAAKCILSDVFPSQKIIDHKNCLLKIYLLFIKEAENICSETKEECICSPSKWILEFLKYCASYNIDYNNPICSEDPCVGGRMSPLNYLALRTYTILAVTRNPSYLAVSCDGNVDFEADPFMVPIESQELQILLREKWEEIKHFLKKRSGIRQIYVRVASSAEGKISLLINSVGKEWRCWKLEEMVLQPNLYKFLKDALEEESNNQQIFEKSESIN